MGLQSWTVSGRRASGQQQFLFTTGRGQTIAALSIAVNGGRGRGLAMRRPGNHNRPPLTARTSSIDRVLSGLVALSSSASNAWVSAAFTTRGTAAGSAAISPSWLSTMRARAPANL
jgi:hypothetical protein